MKSRIAPRGASTSAVLVAVVLAGGLSACTDTTDTADQPSPAPSSTSTSTNGSEGATSAEPTASAVAKPARLVSLEKTSHVKCLEPNPPGDFYTLYQPIFVAKGGDVTLDGVDALGPGVKITGSEAVLLPADADPATDSPGLALGDSWPLKLDARERPAFDLPTRAPLEGFVVPEGRYVMPFLRFRATERGQLAAAVVTYDAGDAGGQASGRIGTKVDAKCD